MVSPAAEPLPPDANREAIGDLLERYGPRLHAVAYRIAGTAEDADDIVQETFLQAYRKWHQFRGDADPGTWLYTIAVRAARRQLRKRIRQRETVGRLEEILPFGDPTMPAAPSQETAVDAEIRQETIGEVDEAIAELPVQFRLPIVLKDIAELSVEQVAGILGIKPATVKTRVHRGRLLMRARLTSDKQKVPMPPPAYERKMCMDLLRSKMESLDRGVPFPVQNELVCERCRTVFEWLDLASDACRHIADGDLPDRVRALVMEEIREDPLPPVRGRG